VALVDKVVDQKGTREVSKAYLDFQYTKDIQQLLTTYNYRVHNPEVVAATAAQFQQIRLINPTEVLGTWDEITAKHFDADGILDQLLAEGR
jgi:sulfate transport system substrate-binding protein